MASGMVYTKVIKAILYFPSHNALILTKEIDGTIIPNRCQRTIYNFTCPYICKRSKTHAQ